MGLCDACNVDVENLEDHTHHLHGTEESVLGAQVEQIA